MLSELVTPEVLQPTPPKKNLVPRFKARIRRGENMITFHRLGIAQKITRPRILNHMGIQRYMVKSNLIQLRLNPEVEIDEDNRGTIRK